MLHPTYTMDRYAQSHRYKLIFIPYVGSCSSSCASLTAAPTTIPCLLYINASRNTNKFCINLHGNACDVGQIAMCAEAEGKACNAHYLLVEYPRFGVADGHPNEVTLNDVAASVYAFVLREFQVHYSSIVLVGRSIGTGPACELASRLQREGTPVAALILQSPHCSIRDVTADLLGCASYFLLDRWQNWRKLIGSDAGVVRSPVLLIHADGDRVISYTHSQLLHEHRCKAGLPCELFTQQSSAGFVKGHNYFDYENDVVRPSCAFLERVWSTPTKQALDGPLVIPGEVVALAQQLPPSWAGRYTDEQEVQYLGSTNVWKSVKCTADVWAGWLCCICCSCTENCFACGVNLSNDACACARPPAFSYTALRPQPGNTLWRAIFAPSSFGKNVREQEAAESADARRTQIMQRRSPGAPAQRRSLRQEGKSSTSNPLLESNMDRGSMERRDIYSAQRSETGLLSAQVALEQAAQGGSSGGGSGGPPVLDYIPG